jgi:hypothetical protein
VGYSGIIDYLGIVSPSISIGSNCSVRSMENLELIAAGAFKIIDS